MLSQLQYAAAPHQVTSTMGWFVISSRGTPE